MFDPNRKLVLLGFNGVIVDKITPKMKTVKGIREVMEELALEYTLIIVCATQDDLIRDHLEREGFLHCFKGIYGKDIGSNRVRILSVILRLANKPGTEALLVTNSYLDILNAQSVNIAAVAVAWNENSPPEQLEAIPAAFITNTEDLAPMIRRLLPQNEKAWD